MEIENLLRYYNNEKVKLLKIISGYIIVTWNRI